MIIKLDQYGKNEDIGLLINSTRGIIYQSQEKDFAEKADQLDNQIFDFFVEINNEFVLPPRPKGWFSSKAKKRWDLGKSVKENLERWVSGYQNLES